MPDVKDIEEEGIATMFNFPTPS